VTKRAPGLDPDQQPIDPSARATKPRAREVTPAPTVGGAFDEDGTCLQPGGLPEPDAHRMKKPER